MWLAAPAASAADRAERAIDRTCAAIADRALAGPHARYARIVGDPMTTSPAWRVPDAAMRDRIAHDPDIYSETADVWNVDGAAAIVNVESRSLELREDASYCFRADGSLARVTATSSGTYNVDDEARYYDARGRLVARNSRLGLLRPRPGATVSPDLRPSRPTIYASVRALPFPAVR